MSTDRDARATRPTPRLVARRRDLPGLPAQLRRRRTATAPATCAGVRSRLPYLRDLGVDAIWFTPWYPSPMADGGYDVADYRDIDPSFGDLAAGRGADQRRRSASASAPSSTSSPTTSRTSTRWFQAGAGRRPGLARAGAVLVPRRPRRATASWPPNGWSPNFGGPAWSPRGRARRHPEQWYLHLFAPGQPDLNWGHPDVARRARGRAALLVRPRRRAASGSTRPPCSPRTRACPRCADEPRPGRAPVRRPRRAAGHLPGLAADRRRRTARTGR